MHTHGKECKENLGRRKFSEGNICSLRYDITAHELPYTLFNCDMFY